MQHTHIFVALSCPPHDPPYINNLVPSPIPHPESRFFHRISRFIYCSSCFWILHRILLATGGSAMVWLFVYPLTFKSVSTIKIMLSHPSSMPLSLNGPMDVKLCKSQENSASPSAHGHSTSAIQDDQNIRIRQSHSLDMADKALPCLRFLRAS
jgi:hypothetical protein